MKKCHYRWNSLKKLLKIILFKKNYRIDNFVLGPKWVFLKKMSTSRIFSSFDEVRRFVFFNKFAYKVKKKRRYRHKRGTKKNPKSPRLFLFFYFLKIWKKTNIFIKFNTNLIIICLKIIVIFIYFFFSIKITILFYWLFI